MRDVTARKILTPVAIAVLLAMAGCSGDDGKNGLNGTSCSVAHDDTTGVSTITCDDGTTAEVADGTVGASCTVEDNGDGTKTITCDDGTTVDVSDGADGAAGSSCTVEDNGDGTKTITCDDGTTVDVTDGATGDSCTVVDNGDGTKTITCEDGTTVDINDGTSCTVVDNGDGTRTISCEDGSTVTVANGEDGIAGGNAQITEFMGTDYLLRSGEFADGKYFVDLAITSATIVAGAVTVDFTANNANDGAPVLNLAAVTGGIAQLQPAAGAEAFNKWVGYIYRQQTIVAGDWPNPAGTSAWQAYRESNGTLTNNGDGTYRYVFATNLLARDAAWPVVTYDAALTHRVTLMTGGHAGATGTANYDFRPDGNAITETRNIVETATCQNCHGWEFHGHGGDRLSVENCVTCHNPGNIDPNGGETVDMKVMIHKIHAGRELPTIPGPDGIVFDNPATVGDESADNGEYAIWGNRDSKADWAGEAFPAMIENCTMCHTGSGEDVNNWRDVPSREACGSCHNDIDWATGANHPGGSAVNDDDCATCHHAEGNSLGGSVTEAHNWLAHDPRNIPEFTVTPTVSAPANGQYFVAGESPVVTVTLTDAVTGAAIDGTTIVEDPANEGCPHVDANADGVWDACPARDGLFRSFNMFVSGPRARRVPVLTTSARSQMFSTVAAPFVIAAAGNLVVTFDQGRAVHTTNVAGGDVLAVGQATVAFAVGSYTVDQVVTTLNSNAAFAARGIAWNDGGTRVGIRSRNLGLVYGIQLAAGAVNTAIFNDTAVHMPIGSTTSNDLRSRTNPANNDPKAVRGAAGITYTLDPVDDLEPGTYVVQFEITDGGRVDAVNYRTPSVARTTFQVKQAGEEAFIARNCNTCHQNATGQGFILDFSRHYKIFNDTAVDQCSGCHDYQPQNNTSAGGGSMGWTGSRPISRRVHGVHFGSELNYPLFTVDYANGDPEPGRNWDITFPRDPRNCEVCHTEDTSGTWMTNPSRLPCSGCHDSDAALAHMKIQTFDPTPNDPWSGDEVESCATCHAVR